MGDPNDRKKSLRDKPVLSSGTIEVPKYRYGKSLFIPLVKSLASSPDCTHACNPRAKDVRAYIGKLRLMSLDYPFTSVESAPLQVENLSKTK